MAIKRWAGLGLLALGGLGGAAWWAGWRPALPDELQGAAATRTVHKCRAADGRLLYSTEPCPAGQQPQTLQGQVNVLPATPLPKPAASSALRQLNDPAEIERLRERRLERAINP